MLAAIANWRFFKPVVSSRALIPRRAAGRQDLASSSSAINESALGVDPNNTLLHETGEDALGFLVASLAVTPVRRIFKINRVQIVRRLLGVTAFFYALAHVSMYLVFDQLCYSFATCDYQQHLDRHPETEIHLRRHDGVHDPDDAGRHVHERVGAAAEEALGDAAPIVYVAAIAGVVHYVWGQKSDISEPLKWAGYVVALLGIRVYFAWQKRSGTAQITARAAASRRIGVMMRSDPPRRCFRPDRSFDWRRLFQPRGTG